MSHSAEQTLPDLLRDGLELVFVGINPSLFSVARGHYFARGTNRFWPCFSRSALSSGVRRALGAERLEPMHDRLLPTHGIGFTDVVKRPTAKAAELGSAEFAAGAAALVAKLERYRPRVACFQGMMGYRPFAAALGWTARRPVLGAQPVLLGRTQVFVVPSPSAANAHFTPAQQTEWYDRLADYLQVASHNSATDLRAPSSGAGPACPIGSEPP
ncbi:MAG TPA: mismatch-specific DNA-glycosylase [Acetobacteraceae bacterium]|nr:mismatch-specific DNA-glycosylase [Acetobacteraceae bacterium]